MPSSTSLSLQALLRSAAGRAGFAHDRGTISGLTPAGRSLYAALRAHQAGDRLIVLVVPTDADADETAADTRFFLAALEGLDDRAAAAAVLPLPSHEVDPYRGLSPHLHVASARARVLASIASGDVRVVVASAPALLPRLVPPRRLASAVLALRLGAEVDPQLLGEHLVESGFSREDPADEHGEFAVRGGIVDVFPPGDDQPVRIEFAGDSIESIRRYDPSTQRSTAAIDQVTILPIRERLGQSGAPADPTLTLEASVIDYFTSRRTPVYLVGELEQARAAAEKFLEQIAASFETVTATANKGAGPVAPPDRLFVSVEDIFGRLSNAVRLEELSIEGGPETAAVHHVRCQVVPEFKGRIQDFIEALRKSRSDGEQAVFVASTTGRAERMIELARDYQVVATPADRTEDAHFAALLVTVGHLARGFRLPDGQLTIYAEADVFEEERRGPEQRRRAATRAFLSDLRDLKVGDFVVHVDHGIGVFVGLKQLSVAPGEPPQEFMELRYSGEDKLFVPVERLDLVQKYTGASRPPVDRLGGQTWEKAKTRVKKAMRDMAEELLKLYAARKAVAGHAFTADSHWQNEFAD